MTEKASYRLLCWNCSKYSPLNNLTCIHCGNNGSEKHFQRVPFPWQEHYEKGDLNSVYLNWLDKNHTRFPHINEIIKFRENKIRNELILIFEDYNDSQTVYDKKLDDFIVRLKDEKN